MTLCDYCGRDIKSDKLSQHVHEEHPDQPTPCEECRELGAIPRQINESGRMRLLCIECAIEARSLTDGLLADGEGDR